MSLLTPSQAFRQILRHVRAVPNFEGSNLKWTTNREAWANEVRKQFESGKMETNPERVAKLRQEASDYAQMLGAMKEKLRLTVEWTASSKMTEKERVRATARRVGLSIREE